MKKVKKPQKEAAPAPDDAVLAEKATAIKAVYAKSVEGMLEAGKLLKEARDGNRGAFRRLLDKHLGWSRTQAYRLIDAHAHFGQCPNVGHFELSAIYLLSTKKCPAQARKVAVQRAAKGTFVTTETAKALIQKYDPEPPDGAGKGESPPYHDIRVPNGAVVKVQVLAGDLTAVEAALVAALEQVRATIKEAK